MIALEHGIEFKNELVVTVACVWRGFALTFSELTVKALKLGYVANIS